MRRIITASFVLFILAFTQTSCLYSGLDTLQNSSDKAMNAIEYTYRFAYNDTIKKGTPQEEIQLGRICEVIFSKNVENINENGIPGFKTTISHNINSIQKAGPAGSVTKEMLYEMFKDCIQADGISKLWVYVTISDAASITALDGAPRLGSPGDFSTDRKYKVTAADGSSQIYQIKTVQGF